MDTAAFREQIRKSIEAEHARVCDPTTFPDEERQRALELNQVIPQAFDVLEALAAGSARQLRLRHDPSSGTRRYGVEWFGTPPTRSLEIEVKESDGHVAWTWSRSGGRPSKSDFAPATRLTDEALTYLLTHLVNDGAWGCAGSVPPPPI